MKDWSRREQALGCAERPFHSPEIFVAEHRFQRRDVGIGAQHEDAIELGVLFRLGPINGETVVAGRGEEPTIALVADQALSPFFNCRSSAARTAARAAASF